MIGKGRRALIVEDNFGHAAPMLRELNRLGFETKRVGGFINKKAARYEIRDYDPSLLVLDDRLAGTRESAPVLLQEMLRENPNLCVLLVSIYGDDEHTRQEYAEIMPQKLIILCKPFGIPAFEKAVVNAMAINTDQEE